MNSKIVQQAFLNYRASLSKETYKNYQSDCIRTVRVIYDSYDIPLTLEESYIIWKAYSENVCAGWLVIGSDSEILHAFEIFIKTYKGLEELVNGI